MRLNKMRLAAAMMSAVMAASTMSTAAFAEDLIVDEDVVSVVSEGTALDEIVEDQVELAGAGFVNVSSVSFTENADGTANAIVHYSDGTSTPENEPLIATKKWIVAQATCTTKATYVWNVQIPGYNTPYSSDKITVGDFAPHVYKETTVVTEKASCTKDGVGQIVEKCEVCGALNSTFTAIPVTIPKYGHEKGESWTEIVNYNNIKKDDLTLSNPKQDGSYTIRTWYKCTNCSEEFFLKDEDEEVKVPAGSVTVTSKTIGKVEGINDSDIVEGKQYTAKADNLIKLTDCSVSGRYQIVTTNSIGESTYEWHTVPAHHVEYVDIIPKGSATVADLVIKRDSDDKIVSVTSAYCYKEIGYYEVVKCAADGKEISRTEKTAGLSNNHSINKTVKDIVDNAKNAGLLTDNNYKTLAAAKGVKLTLKDTCETDGTVEVTYLCLLCGKEVGTPVTLNIKKQGHQWDSAVAENVVDPTCAKEGSYDSVRYCEVCGKREVIRTGITISKLNHSFVGKNDVIDETNAYIAFTGSKVIDENGENLNQKGKAYIPSYLKSFRVTADAVVKCDVCGETSSLTKDYGLSLTVVDIRKETANGLAGSITLKATYTKRLKNNKTEKIENEYTVPYYSDMVAYFERNPEAANINGLVKDEDGVWRYYKDGLVQEDYTGLLTLDDGRMFYITKGELNTTVEGLQLIDGTWYFFALGQVQTQYTGLALYDGEWFYLTKGILDTTVNGLVPYNGKTFLFADGRLVDEYTGLWFYTKNIGGDDEWYYITDGWVRDDYTGSTVYDGVTFQVVNGKLVK